MNSDSYFPRCAPQDQSLDAAQLEQMLLNLEKNFPSICRLWILRRGALVLEKEFPVPAEPKLVKAARSILHRLSGRATAPQKSPEDARAGLWDVRSVTKSVVSILVGMALEEGCLRSLDQTLAELLPERMTPGMEDARKGITLFQLMTMTSGLRSVDAGQPLFGMLGSQDWVQYALALPLDAQPGEKFIYNSASYHLVSAILSRATRQLTLDYARRKLFDPLGIGKFAWGSGPEGVAFGGGNLFLNLESMAKLGLLYLQEGRWEGQQLVSAAWVRESLRQYQVVNHGLSYGLGWWLKEEVDVAGEKRWFTFSASGAGGQKILVIPALELVLVTISRVDFGQDRSDWIHQMVGQHLIRAAIDREV